MRKLCLPITIISLLAALYFGYCYFKLVNTISPISKIDKAKCAPCYEYNNVGTAPSLDMNLVKTMAYNFQSSSSSLDTRSVWFNLETIKSFIYQIESKTCACDSALGVRVYFGKYPVDASWQGAFKPELGNLRTEVALKFGSNKYENINTIFMVPTHKINAINYDFDPNDPNTTCDIKNGGYDINKYSPATKEDASNFTTQRFGSSITALMAQNHGDACPPVEPPAVKCPDAGAYFDF
ncbi:MAG: hypothetical protein HOO89_00170 [Ferruginibacter sp.]|nr:hypothetical protein [Ferruginibacter sp.]